MGSLRETQFPVAPASFVCGGITARRVSNIHPGLYETAEVPEDKQTAYCKKRKKEKRRNEPQSHVPVAQRDLLRLLVTTAKIHT